MAEHTTIQITKEQAEQLAERKAYDDEPYKSVIAKLLNGEDSNSSATANQEEVVESIQNMRDEIMASVNAVCGDSATTEDIGDLADLIRDIDGGSSTVELDASERNKIAREVAEALQ